MAAIIKTRKNIKIFEKKIDDQFCRVTIYPTGKFEGRVRWGLSFVVAPNKKMAREWPKYLVNVQTGHSLRPLLWAKEVIQGFQKTMDRCDILSIEGTDEKRFRAYAFLKRIGFINFMGEYWLYSPSSHLCN